MLNNIIIAEYVEEFINSIILENIHIKVNDREYYIYLNNKKIEEFTICKFYDNKIEEIYSLFNKEKLQFKNDLIGTIFFFISGYWEYINDFPKDKYGRISAKYSFQAKYNLLETPIVDILLKNFILRNNFHYKYDEARYFLTHDIDKLYYNFLRGTVGDIIKRKNFKLFIKNLKTLFLLQNPFSVKKLVHLNSEYNIISNYYFLLGKQDSFSGYDLYKNLKNIKKLKQLLKVEKQNIGLHYGFNHLIGNDLLEKTKEMINFFEIKKLTGRAHYLNFDIKKSFKVYEKAGIEIDCTGGYHDAVGFRFGTSFPFKPYNFEKEKNYNLIEIPLIIMDCTPFYYMNLNTEKGEEKILELINKIIETNGIISILWHNSSFYTREWNDKEKIYIKILEKISKYKHYDIYRE